MFLERIFHTGTVHINYAEGPASGPPLILLHGVTDQWQDFLPLIPALSVNRQVYAIDFRGHGKSGHMADQYHFHDYGEDVYRLIDQQIQRSSVIVGHSLGGLVALWLAANYPDAVRAVIVGDSPIYLDGPTRERLVKWFMFERDLMLSERTQEEIAAALADVLVDVPGHVDPMRMGDLPLNDSATLLYKAKKLRQTDPGALIQLVEYLQESVDPDRILRNIACPTLLIGANPSSGGLLSDFGLQHARETLPRAYAVRLESLGHALHREQPEPVLRVLTNFLEAL